VDIVHSHTAHGVALGAMGCLGTTAKLVITRHSDFRPRANLGTRWKYGRVDALIAISSAARNAMIAGGMSPDSITICAAVPTNPTRSSRRTHPHLHHSAQRRGRRWSYRCHS